MKTVLVIYSDVVLSKKEMGYRKRYAFNTEDDVEVGDLIETNEYNTKLLIAEVFDKSFKYFNRTTGKLTDVYDNSNLFEIKTLKISESGDDDSVTGWKTKEV